MSDVRPTSAPPRALLFGELPMPWGGVQLHCARLMRWLRGQGWTVRAADLPHGRGPPCALDDPEIQHTRNTFVAIVRQIRSFAPDLAHSHVYRWRVTLVLGIWAALAKRGSARPFRTVVTVHGESFFAVVPLPLRPLIRWALRQVDHVIADNATMAGYLRDTVGIAADHTSTIGAFLPPSDAERSAASLPPDVRAFVDSHHPVIVSNGAVATFRGADKYGLDLLIEAFAELVCQDPPLLPAEAGVIVCITRVHEARRMRDLERLVSEHGLTSRVRFVQDLPSLVPLFAAADVSVRATNTDGDALSVHESLMCGTRVVASDVVPRPPLCQLFVNRDAHSLATVLAEAIRLGPLDAADAASVGHAGGELLGLYLRLLGGGDGLNQRSE